MKKLLPTDAFSKLKLVDVAYGMGQSDKSYRETIASAGVATPGFESDYRAFHRCHFSCSQGG